MTAEDVSQTTSELGLQHFQGELTDSSLQECNPGGQCAGLRVPSVPQVHGEAAQVGMAEETAAVSGEKLAAAILRAEGEQPDVPQG